MTLAWNDIIITVALLLTLILTMFLWGAIWLTVVTREVGEKGDQNAP